MARVIDLLSAWSLQTRLSKGKGKGESFPYQHHGYLLLMAANFVTALSA
jgi:hypothetical protein